MSATEATEKFPDVVVTELQAAECGRPPLLVLEPLEAFLDDLDLGQGPLTAEPLGEGHSNVVYRLRRGGAELVLRRPPRPPLPPSAHDVLREARLLEALGPTGVPVPAVVATCEETAVIGAPFVLMEMVPGDILTSRLPIGLAAEAARRDAAFDLIDTLAELHTVDWRRVGLEGFGRGDGYLERQLRRFASLWEENRTRELPVFDGVRDWLADNQPTTRRTTIVHGDYRFGNVILSRSAAPRVAAVLDWEMATIGDPLADLGYLCATWSESGDPPNAFDLTPVTREPGFPSRAELIDRYAHRSVVRVDDLRWYQVLALWKAAVFMEGNYRRALDGLTDDPFVAEFGHGVEELLERAKTLAFGGDR
jgi:aminoglycoside phosphotransferase (APT) family kinase protein